MAEFIKPKMTVKTFEEDPDYEYLGTVAEAAEFLEVDAAEVWRMVGRGDLVRALDLPDSKWAIYRRTSFRESAAGTPLTPEVIERLEREAYDAEPEDWKPTTRRPGRPSLHGGDGDSAQLRLRVPADLRDQLAALAAAEDATLSEYTRHLLEDGVRRATA